MTWTRHDATWMFNNFIKIELNGTKFPYKCKAYKQYIQSLKCHTPPPIMGGGGGDKFRDPCPAPPPTTTLMAANAKEADIWFGRESAREARGKFKDLVCLVVFLCRLNECSWRHIAIQILYVPSVRPSVKVSVNLLQIAPVRTGSLQL